MNDAFAKAVDALTAGQPIVFPTDTVYGLGVSVEHARSPQALYDIKGRDAGKPIAWLVGGPEALDEYGCNVPERARELAREHWPGALTLIVSANARVPGEFLAGGKTIGLRMPDNEVALALIEAVGCPIATTSANVSGSADARTGADLDPAVLGAVSACVIDDGGQDGPPSTVVDCTSERLEVLREGALNLR